MTSSTSSSRRISASRVRRTAKSHSARSRASSTFATAHATDPPVQSSRGKDKTKMTPPAVADGPQSVRQGALSGTSTSTTATIQASSARATDFFNALLKPEYIAPGHWVVDIIYFPLETELLRHARCLGCQTSSGEGMAVFQAVRAFELFTGVEPNIDVMRATFADFDRASIE